MTACDGSTGKMEKKKKIKLQVEDVKRLIHCKLHWSHRRNCFLHDNIEEQMTEVKGVGGGRRRRRRRRRSTQLLNDLTNRRGYWELKEEAEDRNRCKRQFIIRT